VPDDVKDESVEEVADGREETERERFLMFIHLHLVQDTAADTSLTPSQQQRQKTRSQAIIIDDNEDDRDFQFMFNHS